MRMQSTQRGMTFWGMTIVMAMAGFLVLLAMRLLPVYADDIKAVKALDRLKIGPEDRTREIIVGQFFRQLTIDDVRNVPREALKLEPQGGGFSINLDYEVRVPVVYNVDAVVKFSHHQDIR